MQSTVESDYPLPVALTRLIGREQEEQALHALLAQPAVRLLTLTGPGGIGKTRLALAAASTARPLFPHGVCFVSLASTHEPAQVLPLLAQALGLRENSGRSLQDVLTLFLQKRRLLLVIDNFEHVMTAAPDLEALLPARSGVTLLVTSRAALRLPREVLFAVPPLPLPAPGNSSSPTKLASNPAVTLFVERARAVNPSFCLNKENAPAIARICVLLDGLPLALELAAARTRLLSARELLERLPHNLDLLTSGGKAGPARQQTLRATIQWSYQLLSPQEQKLFRYLSLFADGCSLTSLSGLYAELYEETHDLPALLASLRHKSLLTAQQRRDGEERLMLLQTLREFGLEQLEEHGARERCALAHAAYFSTYVKHAVMSRPLPFHDAPVEKLSAEYANIRATLTTFFTYHDYKAALYLACSLTPYWVLCNLFAEGRNVLEQLLQAATQQPENEELRRILPVAYNSAGWLAYWQNDLEAASRFVQTSLELFQTRQSTQWQGNLWRLSALIEMTRPEGNFLQGEKLYREGTDLHRARGERGLVGFSLLGLVTMRLQLGELAENKALSLESLELCQDFDLPWAVGGNFHHLGWLAYLEGDYTTALAYTEKALHLLRRAEVALYLDEALMVYAFEQFALGKRAAASAALHELRTLARANENDSFLFYTYYGQARLALLSDDLRQASRCFEKALGAIGANWRANRTAWWLPSCLEGIAMVAWRQGEPVQATRLFAAAHTRRCGQGCYFALGQEKSVCEEALRQARTTLGQETFTRCWEEGRVLLPASALPARELLTLSLATPVPSPAAPHKTLPPASRSLDLTPREWETLNLLAQGLTNRQIGEQLVLSVTTVNSYLRSIYSKLGVKSRTAAMRYARDHQPG